MALLSLHCGHGITTHTLVGCRARLSSPGLGSLLNHLAEHCILYWANWIPQYQNQKMLSSINWLPPAYCTRQGKTTSTEKPTDQITRIVTANNWAWHWPVAAKRVGLLKKPQKGVNRKEKCFLSSRTQWPWQIKNKVQGLQEKGLQSRSIMTVCLFIK